MASLMITQTGSSSTLDQTRENTGLKKIAAEVAAVIGTTHAKVELAQFQGERGSVTESFARGGRVLHHGQPNVRSGR